MRLRQCFGLALLLFAAGCQQRVADQRGEFPTPFEQGDGNSTATYREVIDFYIALAREFPEINIQTHGTTDSGMPLHLATYNPEGSFNFARLRQDKLVVLILNGIHPGEPDGIDASMQLFRDLATGVISLPEGLVVATIPVYNIGGALQRNADTRVNQNGPAAYGFRGNARNFDLNRDFLKMDTRNARTFAEIFHLVQPDLFLDTHVSNGADYQYTLTHLFTQPDKLGGALGRFQEDSLRSGLEAALGEAGWEITPYVNVFNRPPDGGFVQFMDYPRYSTGYAALWNTPSLMLETHMLKPYAERVEGTYVFMQQLLDLAGRHREQIRTLRGEAGGAFQPGNYYPTRWEVDSLVADTLAFRGFEADTLPSAVTGLPRLKYDQARPFTRPVPYYNHFRATDSVRIPEAYLIPAQWTEVRDRLDQNRIEYRVLEADSVLQVTAYGISGYDTYGAAYEGHYPHYNTRVSSASREVAFRAGDLYVPVAQKGARYLLEALEPAAADSFFNWNFFDTVLQMKEGFSPYVFEERAEALLAADSLLRSEFEAKRASDAEFAADAYGQLNWIYMRSPHAEAPYLNYPVYRLEFEE